MKHNNRQSGQRFFLLIDKKEKKPAMISMPIVFNLSTFLCVLVAMTSI